MMATTNRKPSRAVHPETGQEGRDDYTLLYLAIAFAAAAAIAAVLPPLAGH